MKKSLITLLLPFIMLPGISQAADLANGKSLNKNCALCHGTHGQGASGKLSPRLAGLPKEYLIKALEDYRSGKRQNYMMMKTAALDTISDKDIEDVSAYLSAIEIKKDPAFDIIQPTGDPEEGKDTFKGDCKSCHGRDGFGKPKKGAPPLAGQHHEYLFQSFKMFQSKLRHHDNDIEDETFDDLTDKDLTNITAYIATLDNKKFDTTGATKIKVPDVVAKRAVPAAPAPVIAAASANSAPAKAPVKKNPGLQVQDITQTVAQMQLEEGVTPEDAIQAMLSKATEINFKVVGQQHVSKELEARGVETPFLSIMQFCDPMDAREMIINNPIFASYMPCRISVVEDKDNKTWLMMLNLDMLINSELLDTKVVDTAIRVNSALLEIMVAGATGDF
ncbi:MAG: Unknown protein [uncultured Thiotrichaceae bacterium]|uniref:Cytochrome c domain-containing protein n=1 Tax=uncultured Thiotrichaceae bacterium TaxID=298394 RepID=A0A6S6SHH8_9GAMM|nr:MAG: Unknown protein [uncultured Thiotrichaceae bacterium]